MLCPNCHNEVHPGAAFCGNCGFLLGTAAQSPQVQYAAPQPLAAPTVVQPQQGVPAQPLAAAYPAAPQVAAPQLNPAPFAAQMSPQQPVYYAPPVPGVVGGIVNPAMNAPAVSTANNGKAIAGFVLGVLGCIGWLIPPIGIVMGILAIIFGTIAFRSQRRVLAIIGMSLAVPVIALSFFAWVKGVQYVEKNRADTAAGKGQTVASADGGDLQTVSTPCYSVSIPSGMEINKAENSCTFSTSETSGGEQYVIKVINVAKLNTLTLPSIAKADAENVVKLNPGSSITNHTEDYFAKSPAYYVQFSAADGETGTVSYVYKVTPSGNLVIIFHTQKKDVTSDLAAIEDTWIWK